MKRHSNKLWTIMTSILAVLLVIVLVATVVANYFSTSINAFLLCDTYKVVSSDDSENNLYFPDEWEEYDDWFAFHEEEICTLTEAEGAVLLKNERQALPLSEGSKVSLFSHSSVDMIYGGTGSGSVNTSTAPNLREGIEQAGGIVNSDLWSFYNVGNGSSYKRGVPALSSCSAVGDYTINEVPWSVIELESGLSGTFATYGDAAIFVLARSGGEGRDLATDDCTDEGTNGDYLALSTAERDTLSALKSLKDEGIFSKIVVLLNSSNAVNCDFLDDEQYGIDACLWIGGVGAYGNNAVGDLLYGKSNPSGRLVDTYLYDNFINPSMVNFGDVVYPNAAEMGLTDTDDQNQTNVNYVVYQEGIYVGYKYYETRYADQVMNEANAGSVADFDYGSTVYRTFGYGLSYTTFEYSDFSVKESSEEFEISLNVTNTGSVKGKHTVQIYMQKPYTEYDRENNVEKSAVELVGYAKTDFLSSGESESVVIQVSKEQMKSYDAYGEGTYIVDEGTYYLTVGTDSHNALNNILATQGYTSENEFMDADGNVENVYAYEQKDFDAKKYSVSEATGVEITNQFDDVDLNIYEGSDTDVTYLSRKDWIGTYPKETISILVTEKMATDILNEYVAKTVDEEGNSYEIPTYGANNGLTLAMLMGVPYDDAKWEDLLDQMTFAEQEQIIVNAFHNTKAANSISKPATVETNGPQGITDSFFGGKKAGMAYPAEVVMASTWNNQIMEEIGNNIGIQGLKTKTNGLYGPAANIHRNAYCGRNYEYFSEDAFLSGKLMASEIEKIQAQGVYVFMKHFALNDQETHRAGLMVWANEQSIRESYLQAFEYSVTEADAKGAMTIMNRIGSTWGGAHNGLLTQVLRNEWGFEGIVITDYSSNSNYTLQTAGLEGGSNIWDGFESSDISDKQNDPYITQLMRNAIHDVLYVQVNSSAMNGISQGDRIVSILTWWQVTLIALDIVFLLLLMGSIIMLVKSKGIKSE